MPLNKDHFALVIGVNDYPNYRGLAGAKADAQRFAAWLTDQNTGGGLPRPPADPAIPRLGEGPNCKVFLSELNPPPPRPIDDEIDEALSDMLESIETAERFYFYFSGHGLALTPKKNQICLPNYSDRFPGRSLNLESYVERILDTRKFREVVFFLDCCRSSSSGEDGRDCALRQGIMLGNAIDTQTFIAFATLPNSAAYEAKIGGGNGAEVRGHFTTALLDALNGAAASAAGGVTVSDLKKYLNLHVPRIAKKHGHKQKCRVEEGFDFGDEGQEAVFGSALPPSAEPVEVTIRFSPGRVGPITLTGPEREIPCPNPAAEWKVPCVPGLHLLSDQARGDQKDFDVVAGSQALNVDF